MGMFSERDEVEPYDDDFGPAENVSILAQLRFTTHGIVVEPDPDTAGLDTVLVEADGSRHPLRAVIERAVAGEEPVAVAMEFVDGVLAAREAQQLESLSDHDLQRIIRTMVIPAAEAVGIGASYAVPVSAGLVAVLGVELPTGSTLLPDTYLAGRDTDDLFARGLAHVMAVPVDDVRDLELGSQLVLGSSNYTATKMLGMSQLLADHSIVAPHGLLFGVPNRHLLYVHPLADRSSLSTVRNFALMVAGQAVQRDNPGGALSGDLFIWRNGRIERAGGVDEAVTLQMDVKGLLLESMLELVGPAWNHDMFGTAPHPESEGFAGDAEVAEDAPLELTAAEFSERTRARIVSEELAGKLGLSYATEIAPGLRLVLCLDSEDEVLYITDDMLAGRNVDELREHGTRSIMNEPFETIQDVGEGITGLYGESFFTASKVVGMADLIGSVLPLAPYGVLFGVPHRHALYVHVITGVESIDIVARLASHVDTTAKDEPIPGGPVSAWTYYWHEGSVDVVAGVNDRGVQVDGSGRFGELMASFAAV